MTEVLFYKVQNRPDYLAYVGERPNDKLIARINKGEDGDWVVEMVPDRLEEAAIYPSATAAKAFVDGFVAAADHFEVER